MKAKNNEPIDFVITWVDGSDPKWLEDRKKYAPKGEIFDESRFRDWGLLKYWFRAVEANAPWVRKIHFVTYGHIPVWLNTKNPKLHIVKHEDFIDKKYLPTFNSCAIEVNLHKIPGLAEQFVYFNDDMYLNGPVKPNYFFKNGKPTDSLILKPIYPIDNSSCGIQKRCMEIINKHFKVSDLKRGKLYTPKNGAYSIYNFILSKYKYIIGINSKHLPQAYRKSTFETVCAREPELIRETQAHRFRTDRDVSQWLFQYWQLVSNCFESQLFKNKACYHIDTKEQAKVASKRIAKATEKLICLNDTVENKSQVHEIAQMVETAMKRKFDKKSQYEQ